MNFRAELTFGQDVFAIEVCDKVYCEFKNLKCILAYDRLLNDKN